MLVWKASYKTRWGHPKQYKRGWLHESNYRDRTLAIHNSPYSIDICRTIGSLVISVKIEQSWCSNPPLPLLLSRVIACGLTSWFFNDFHDANVMSLMANIHETNSCLDVTPGFCKFTNISMCFKLWSVYFFTQNYNYSGIFIIVQI